MGFSIVRSHKGVADLRIPCGFQVEGPEIPARFLHHDDLTLAGALLQVRVYTDEDYNKVAGTIDISPAGRTQGIHRFHYTGPHLPGKRDYEWIHEIAAELLEEFDGLHIHEHPRPTKLAKAALETSCETMKADCPVATLAPNFRSTLCSRSDLARVMATYIAFLFPVPAFLDTRIFVAGKRLWLLREAPYVDNNQPLDFRGHEVIWACGSRAVINAVASYGGKNKADGPHGDELDKILDEPGIREFTMFKKFAGAD